MQTTYRAQVAVNLDSNLPEDDITNTWHFRGTDPGTTEALDAAAITSVLDVFYKAIDGAIYPVQVGATYDVKVYNLADAQPRVPVLSGSGTLTPSATASLPSEVAICLSFQGPPVSGLNQARRRGRVFLGPLHTGVSVASADGQPRLQASTATTLAFEADALLTAAGVANVPWCVYSPTIHQTGTLLEASVDVTSGWIDNAFDTIRSRGPRSTSRTVFS